MAEGQNELVIDLQWHDNTGVKVTKFTRWAAATTSSTTLITSWKTAARPLAGQSFRPVEAGQQPGTLGRRLWRHGASPFLGAATQPDDHFTKFTFEQMKEDPFKASFPGRLDRDPALFPQRLDPDPTKPHLQHAGHQQRV